MLILKNKKDLALELQNQTYLNLKTFLNDHTLINTRELSSYIRNVVSFNSVKKQFNVSFAHILNDSFTDDCHDHIHGHNMTIILELCYFTSEFTFDISDALNPDFMVMDFTLVKSLCKGIHDAIDHRFICPPNKVPRDYSHDCNIIQVSFNPTSEALGRVIGFSVMKTLYDATNIETNDETTKNIITKYLENVWVKSVSVKETEDNIAVCNFPFH